MATAVFHTFDDQPVAKAPISQHPLFPAIVAAWFAALLGLGTLVLPGILLERLVGATGLATIMPAAQPPLGSTARILVAAAAGTIGALLGLFLARQVVRANEAPIAKPVGKAAIGRRPISAHEELGDEGLGTDQRHGFLVNLGDAGHAANPVDWPPSEPIARRAESEPLELLDFVTDEPAPLELDTEAGEPQDASMIEPSPPLADEPKPSHARLVKPIELEPASQPEWVKAPLDSLGMSQLVQRLGASLEKRRESMAAARAGAHAAAAPVEFEAAGAEDAANARAAYFGRHPSEATDQAHGAAFGSLLDLGRPASSALSNATPSYATPADADEALRRALATLQRMSSVG